MSGLSYDHLRLAIERGGADGLKMVLGEKIEQGNVRVTKNKTVVGKIMITFAKPFLIVKACSEHWF